MSRLFQRFLFFLIIIAVVIALYYFGLSKYITLESLKLHGMSLKNFVDTNYLFSVFLYVVIVMSAIIFALPLGPLFALAGGYLFGTVPAILYSELAFTFGATIAFILYRYFFYDLIHTKYHARLALFEQQVKSDGASYLLMLQFLGGIPFFVINIIAVLADIDLFTVAWTSAVGSFPFLIIYCFAGSQLAYITTLKDLMSVRMFIVFILLALLAMIPIFIKRIRKKYIQKIDEL